MARLAQWDDRIRMMAARRDPNTGRSVTNFERLERRIIELERKVSELEKKQKVLKPFEFVKEQPTEVEEYGGLNFFSF